MPRVTLYVKDSDLPVWEAARTLAESRQESLSTLVTMALEVVGAQRDHARTPQATADEDAMSPLELHGWDWFRRDQPRHLRFVGAKIGHEGTVTAYLTRGRRVILEEWQILDERYLAVFDSFEALQAHPLAEALDSGLLVDLAGAAGAPFVEVID